MKRHPEWVGLRGVARTKDPVEATWARLFPSKADTTNLKQIFRRSVRAIIHRCAALDDGTDGDKENVLLRKCSAVVTSFACINRYNVITYGSALRLDLYTHE